MGRRRFAFASCAPGGVAHIGPRAVPGRPTGWSDYVPGYPPIRTRGRGRSAVLSTHGRPWPAILGRQVRHGARVPAGRGGRRPPRLHHQPRHRRAGAGARRRPRPLGPPGRRRADRALGDGGRRGRHPRRRGHRLRRPGRHLPRPAGGGLDRRRRPVARRRGHGGHRRHRHRVRQRRNRASPRAGSGRLLRHWGAADVAGRPHPPPRARAGRRPHRRPGPAARRRRRGRAPTHRPRRPRRHRAQPHRRAPERGRRPPGPRQGPRRGRRGPRPGRAGGPGEPPGRAGDRRPAAGAG